MDTAALSPLKMDETRAFPVMTPEAKNTSRNESAAHNEQSRQEKEPTPVRKTHHASSSRGEYVLAPGDDDSKRPLISKSRSRYVVPERDRGPVTLNNMAELQQHLELMHDRCISRNLRAAGLGGFDIEDEVLYSILDPNAHMATGETMLTATVLFWKEPERLHNYVSILLNDGADVNEQDSQGKTALMHAVLNGRYKAVKAIVRHEKTDLLIRDNDGNTALMHAAATGSEHVLFYFFKYLRKREKHQFQRRYSHNSDDRKTSNGESSKGKPKSDQNGNEGANDGKELWSLLRSDDPLDIQNLRGETARVIALKNGHVECANYIGEEKLRRAKEMNKRLSALTHQRSGSPSILRFAKRSAKKALQHYGSFDSLYFDREDESDDELMLTASQIRRSHTVDPNAIAKISDAKPPIPAPTNQISASRQRRNSKKGLLLLLNKRFQSNPDIFRVKASCNGLSENFPPATRVVAESVGGPLKKGQSGTTGPNEAETEKHHVEQRRNMIKSISGGLKPRQQTHQPASPLSHQPIIKGASAGAIQQRRPSTGPGPHKRNFADKLMSFLRIRPKCHVTSSASDVTLCASTSNARPPKRHLLKKYSQQYPDFSSIDQEKVNGETNLRKSYSHLDNKAVEELNQIGPQRSRVAISSTVTADLSDLHNAGQQWHSSVDLSSVPPLYKQYIADVTAQKYINCSY